jgi:hypothetical protein
MSSLTHHHNKKTGVTYVYSVESYWDKKKKAPRNRQVCIGKLDKATGEIIPTQRKAKDSKKDELTGVTAETRIAGPALLLDKLAKDIGLTNIFSRCFPKLHAEIMSLVYFIVQKGLPLSRSEAWSKGHLHPYGELIVSQRISELLLSIQDESDLDN